MRAQIFTIFFLLLRALKASDILKSSVEVVEDEQPEKISSSEQEVYTSLQSITVQRQQVLDELLNNFNTLIEPLELSAIPWDVAACFGWPEEVESKFAKDWTSTDLTILRQNLSKIHFKLLVTGESLSELKAWNVVFSEMILKGSYYNSVFAEFTEHYRIISKIGAGSFGFVLKCERVSDSLPCAVKFILKPKVGFSRFIINEKFGRVPAEVDVLSRLDHPNIVKFMDYFDDGTYGYMVTELFGTSWNSTNLELNPIQNPTLRTHITIEKASNDLFDCIDMHSRFFEDTIHKIFSQVYEAVMYLYEHGMIHGDLKSENVLVDADYNVKLVDFGLSRLIPRDSLGTETRLHCSIGTLGSMAPEMLLNKPKFASETETWSLGVLLFLLKYFKNPFNNCQQGRTLKFPSNDETGKFRCVLISFYFIFCRNL